MQLLPVLDVRHGLVVRAGRGVRDTYQPLQSQQLPSPDPLSVANALAACYSLRCFYVADLDGILDGTPNLTMLRSLADRGFQIIADVGVRRFNDVQIAKDAGVDTVVVGTETLLDPSDLATFVTHWKILLSID